MPRASCEGSAWGKGTRWNSVATHEGPPRCRKTMRHLGKREVTDDAEDEHGRAACAKVELLTTMLEDRDGEPQEKLDEHQEFRWKWTSVDD